MLAYFKEFIESKLIHMRNDNSWVEAYLSVIYDGDCGDQKFTFNVKEIDCSFVI